MTFRELLKRKGFSQNRLSKVSGVSQSNLSIYCNYRETLEASTQLTRMKLSRAFGMELKEFEELLDLSDSQALASNRQTGDYKVVEIKNEGN